MRNFQVTDNMSRVVLTSVEKAEINKKLKGLAAKRRLNVAIAIRKAQEIFITK